MPNSDPLSVDRAAEAFELNQDIEDSFIQFEIPSDREDENYDATQEEILSDEVWKNKSNDQSIVFEETGSKLDIAQKEAQFSLSLRKRKDSIKSDAKMFLYVQMQLCQRLSLRDSKSNELNFMAKIW